MGVGPDKKNKQNKKTTTISSWKWCFVISEVSLNTISACLISSEFLHTFTGYNLSAFIKGADNYISNLLVNKVRELLPERNFDVKLVNVPINLNIYFVWSARISEKKRWEQIMYIYKTVCFFTLLS